MSSIPPFNVSEFLQSGPDYFVEVDIVMDGATPLWKAHDISQALQDKLEVLPNVERVFVHVDHETTHVPVCVFWFLTSWFLVLIGWDIGTSEVCLESACRRIWNDDTSVYQRKLLI